MLHKRSQDAQIQPATLGLLLKNLSHLSYLCINAHTYNRESVQNSLQGEADSALS